MGEFFFCFAIDFLEARAGAFLCSLRFIAFALFACAVSHLVVALLARASGEGFAAADAVGFAMPHSPIPL